MELRLAEKLKKGDSLVFNKNAKVPGAISNSQNLDLNKVYYFDYLKPDGWIIFTDKLGNYQSGYKYIWLELATEAAKILYGST